MILAAGASRRLGRPKQDIVIAGETLLQRTIRLAREASLSPVVVVTRADSKHGDNLESDVLGAKTVGMSSILVLSGVATRRDLALLTPQQQPDIVIESLTDLL